MFGLLISGRQIDPTPQTISQTQYAFTIPSKPSFSHIALFSLPGQELPPEAAAAIYIQIPPSTEFKFIGALSSARPSGIYRIKNGGGGGGGAMDGAMATNTTTNGGDDDLMVDEEAPVPNGMESAGAPPIVLGIEIQPVDTVKALLAEQKTNASSQLVGVPPPPQIPTASPVTTKLLAQRIIGNAFNFLASFGSDTIPLKAFEAWWRKFEDRVNNDPSFLERPQD